MTKPHPQPLDLDAIEARAEAAIKGPWHVEYFGNHGYPQRIGNDAAILVADTHEGGEGLRPTPEFIAHARTDVPALVAEVKQLRERVAELAKDSEFIEALMAAGVDNWEGYGHAQDIFREWQDGGDQ